MVPSYQDAVCALRLAVWTLERAVGRDAPEVLHVVELIVRRAEQLRSEILVAQRGERLALASCASAASFR